MEKISSQDRAQSLSPSSAHFESQYLSSLFRSLAIQEPEVAHHSNRVHEWVRQWFEFLNAETQLQVDQEVKQVCSIQIEIELAALLHDIGKIDVDSDVLNKKQALTEEEWQQLKLHVDLGYQKTKNLPGFDLIATLIRQHHERFDGKGYPMGLEADQIMPGAQMISITDAFDAMTSERCYQKQKSVSEALEELQNEAGRQFDPYWVKSFIRFYQYSFDVRVEQKV